MKGTYCGIAIALALAVAPAIARADVSVGIGAPAASSTSTVQAAPSIAVSAPAPATAAASIPAVPAAGSVSGSVPAPASILAVSAAGSVSGSVPASAALQHAAADTGTKALVSKTAAKSKVTARSRTIVASRRVGAATVDVKAKVAATVATSVRVRVKVKAKAHVAQHIGFFSDGTREPECTDTFPKSITEVYKCKNQPLDTQQTNDCNGDDVQLHGWFQYSVKTITDPITGTVTIYEKLKWQDVTGYAIQDLNPYKADDKEKTFQTQQQLFLGFRYVTDHSQSEKLVSQGSDPDMFVKIKTHTVVIADFSDPLHPVVVTDESQSGPGVTCKGDGDDD
jgi:hypothetical protein